LRIIESTNFSINGHQCSGIITKLRKEDLENDNNLPFMAPNKVANFASTNYYNQGSTPSQNSSGPTLPISPLKNQQKPLLGQQMYPYNQYPGQGQNYQGYQNSATAGNHTYPGYGQNSGAGHFGSGELGTQQSQQQIDMNRYNQQWSEYWQKYQKIQQQLQYQQQQQSINQQNSTEPAETGLVEYNVTATGQAIPPVLPTAMAMELEEGEVVMPPEAIKPPDYDPITEDSDCALEVPLPLIIVNSLRYKIKLEYWKLWNQFYQRPCGFRAKKRWVCA
jgi:hypothetical protein